MSAVPVGMSHQAALEALKLCEQENDNLRAIFKWVVPLLVEKNREELAEKLDHPIACGGVTSTMEDDAFEDESRMTRIIQQATEHFEKILDENFKPNGVWYQRADHLINLLREFEPKVPLMRKAGNYPNVYVPLKKGSVK